MRLDKYLADCGVGSRTDIKRLIKSGVVRVTGIPAPKPETKVEPTDAEVFVNGVKVEYREFVYLMLNKPRGYLSSTRDGRQPIVLDLVPEEYSHFDLFPAGRLDIDTEGLCLLTNDGQLAHRILSPARHIPKTYYVETDIPVEDGVIEEFSKGVDLDDGYHTLPAELKIFEDRRCCEITITEGKFHQIKRMFQATGNKVTYLKRIKMNKLCLDESLELGEIRELTDEEVALLEI